VKKKEAEEKAREEKRLAKEAAKVEKSNATNGDDESSGPTPDGTKKVEILQRNDKQDRKATETETAEEETQNGEIVDDKAVKPRETTRDVRSKPTESGAWRRPSGGPKPPRNDAPRGPRADGPPRGPRNDGSRPPRTNGGTASPPAQPSPVETEAAALAEDGWSTVSKPKKNQRGGNQGARAIAS